MNPAGCTRGQMDHFSLRRFFDRSMIACLEFFCKRYQFFIRAFVAIFFAAKAKDSWLFFFAAKAKDIHSSFVNSWLFFSAAKAKDIHSSFVNSWLFFLLQRQKIYILHS